MNKETELKPCREAFEAYYTKQFLGVNVGSALDKFESGMYKQADTHFVWLGFHAAWEHKNAIEAQLQAENERLHKILKDAYTYLVINEKHPQYNLEKAVQILQDIEAALQHNEAL